MSPLVADLADLAVDVETPSGDVLAVDDPALLRELAKWDDGGPALTLVRSERALTDCHPISLFSVQTAQQLRGELGVPLDNRRFRANISLDLRGATGFTEDAFVGQRLQIGSKVVLRARHAPALGWARRTAADSVRSRRRRGQPMRTIEMSAEDMAPRVARYKELQPLAIQDDPDIPIEAKDLIYARRILSVIGLEGVRTPVNDGAPIKGAGGMTIGLAICPPGQGPSLHSHGTTYETFTVLEGRFEISWNDDGRESLVLDRFDTVSVPPGVSRAFRNVGEEEGILQVLITGGVHDMTDIDFAPSVAEKLTAVHGPALDAFKEVGFTFTAGVD